MSWLIQALYNNIGMHAIIATDYLHPWCMYNRFSKHDQIGEVRIPLNTIDLAQTIEEWRNLTKVETDGGQVSNHLSFNSN